MKKNANRIIVITGLLLVASIMLCSCGGDKKAKQEVAQEKEKYISYSNVSPLMNNNTWKYSSDDIGCEVYKWAEGVELPLPKPEETTGVEKVEDGYYALGMNKEKWEKYIKLLSEKYIVDVEYSDWLGEGDSCFVTVTDIENNILTYMSWSAEMPSYNMKNSFSITVHVGSNLKNTKYTNKEVLDMTMKELKITDYEGFGIVNVNSETNYIDGFDVYYIDPSEKHSKENDIIGYLCVIKDDKIVLAEATYMYFNLNDSLEFLKVDGQWKMYATRLYMGGNMWHHLVEYELVEGKFIRSQEIDLQSISKEAKGWSDVYCVALKKNGDAIDVYNIKRMTDTRIDLYEWGGKEFIINGSGMEWLDSSSENVNPNDEMTTEEMNGDVQEETTEDIVQNAKDNSDISCRLEGNTLYVSGKGYVSNEDKSKWEAYIHDIEKIVIEEGVEVIGYSAFREVPYVKEVVISGSVKIIESEAFIICSELNSIKLEEGIEVIGPQAFCYCDLMSLEIPETVKEIGYLAFAYSVNLDNYEIPTDVSIGSNAFYRTKMLDDLVAKTGLAIVNGVLYDGKLAEGDVVIPDGVTKIEEDAFYCNEKMTSVEIPESVVCIGDGAFESCKVLNKVKFNATVKEPGSGIFLGCAALEEIEIAEGIEVISFGMFRDCIALRKIKVPKTVRSIQTMAFSGCSSIESLDVSSIESIGFDVFSYCESLKSIKLPEKLDMEETMAFAGCQSLETIYGVKGTYAEKLAQKLDCEFIAE